MARTKIFATVDDELIAWMDSEVQKRRFRNRSHAVEYAIAELKKRNQKCQK